MKRFAHNLMAGLITTCVLVGAPYQALSQPTAQYPTKVVRLVTASGPGGGMDVMTRLVAPPLGQALGQTVMVENRGGAGGNIASAYVAKTAPDGYTLLVTANNHIINQFVYKNPGYDARKDYAPVVLLGEGPSILITGARSPYRSFMDVIKAARSQPGKLMYGSAGSGSTTNIQGEMLKKAANINLTHVPYKGGGPANQDVLAGQIPFALADPSAVAQHIKAGTLRALAVTSVKRWQSLPNVPTVAELGYPGFNHVTWVGVFAPAGTPSAIITLLNKKFTEALANPATHERIVGLGRMPGGRSVADFGAMLKADYEATGKLVSEIGLKVD